MEVQPQGMPKRPREHRLEDLALTKLHTIFHGKGWIPEEIKRDYGEDLFVRIFDRGRTTNLSFFVQCKATDSLKMIHDKGELFIPVRITTDHLRHWSRLWQPVLLTIYDAKTEVTYWEMIHTQLESDRVPFPNTRSQRVSIRVPALNTLDSSGLKRIHLRTKKRFARLDAEKEGAKLLLEVISEKWGVKIEYDVRNEMIGLPDGRFRKSKRSGVEYYFFGSLHKLIARASSLTGLKPQRLIEEAVSSTLDIHEEILAKGQAEVVMADGSKKLYTQYQRSGTKSVRMIEGVVGHDPWNISVHRNEPLPRPTICLRNQACSGLPFVRDLY